MFGKQLRNRDRRSDYSFKKHLARLKREGRLPQIGLGTMALVLVAAVTFGRCESSITGPETDNGSVGGPSLHGTGLPGTPGTDVFKQRTVERNVVFLGVNPCNGDVVRAVGTRYESLTLIAREEAGYFESRSRIKDYFRGYAINDPPPSPTRYKGEDEHEHNEIISPTRVENEIETHEHLVAIGPEPDWKLFFYERRRTDPTQPWNTRVDYRAKASCSHGCALPQGCIDREMSLASFSEREIPSIPVAAPLP